MFRKIFPTAAAIFFLSAIFVSCQQTASDKSNNETKKDSVTSIKLGVAVQITISTNDLAKSQAFYEKLGFKKVGEVSTGVQLSDESLLIILQPSKEHYIRISYFSADADKLIEPLEKRGVHFKTKNEDMGMYTRSIFSATDSIEIALVKMDASNIYKPKGKDWGKMKKEEHGKLENYPNKVIGAFGEFSFSVKNLDSSYAFLSRLGFKGEKFTQPYPWSTVTDSLMNIGLHQETDWLNPTITYFAPDMDKKIAAVEKMGIKTKRFMAPGNVVIVAPEGTHLFLFKE